jgi:hypothetical protein
MEVTIENVDTIELQDFAVWVNRNIMGVKIPQPGPNLALSSCVPLIIPLYADIPNRMALATELYSMVAATVAGQKKDKANPENAAFKKDIEANLVDTNARLDILYRCIQTLAAQYEGASRLLTAAEAQTRMDGRPRIGPPV